MANPFAEKSDRTWQEGHDCLTNGNVNSAASRLYHAVFQAVKGFAMVRLAMTEDSSDRVHATAIRIVGEHGKSGNGPYYRQRYNLLFAQRVKADYMREDVVAEDLQRLLTDADMIRKFFIGKCV